MVTFILMRTSQKMHGSFRGFDWRDEERPKSVEDLFKDDDPFELPVIKGLGRLYTSRRFFR